MRAAASSILISIALSSPVAFLLANPVRAETPPTLALAPEDDGEKKTVILPPIDPARLNLITLESVARSNSRWFQFHTGGSIYDAHRESLIGRWSPGFQFGRRYERFGYFLNLELDQTFDLTQEVRRIDVIHIGPGIEYLQFLGHVRSSLSVGAAFLRTDTDIDSRGKTGWYVDFRPAALRWAWGRKGVIELTPLSMDVSVPVTKGIPLVLFSYFTVLSLEWAEEVGPRDPALQSSP